MLPPVSEDLLLHILSRLPAISLMRFRCVSKSWRDLIDSSYFAQLHLNKSLADINTRKIFVFYEDIVDGYRLYTTSFDLGSNITDFEEINPPVRYTDPRPRQISLIGSCRFIVCLRYCFDRYRKDKIVLWNPSTRNDHIVLPFTPVKIEASQGVEYRRYTFSYGLGFDSATDDYKVVRLVLDTVNKDYEVKAYRLKLGTWERIERIRVCINGVMSKACFFNGSMNWCVRKADNNSYAHLRLCLATNTVRLEPLPEIPRVQTINYSGSLAFCSDCNLWTRHCSSHDHHILTSLRRGPHHDEYCLDCATWVCRCSNENSYLLKLILRSPCEGMISPETSVAYQLREENLSTKLALVQKKLLLKSTRMDMCCWNDSIVPVKKSKKRRRAKRGVESKTAEH